MGIFIALPIIIIINLFCVCCYIITKDFDWLIPIFYLLFMLIMCLTFLYSIYFGIILIVFIFILSLGV